MPPTAVAAQYVRMSTRHQQYSIENQKLAISQYADLHGFQIVRTYVDAAQSGVRAENRAALQELFRDVLGGSANYSVILVYDVSRWGRFQDCDEAAHYEFLCKSAGVVVHYCNERFQNDGTWLNQLLKVVRRTMAAEYSRELGVKVYAGQKRLAQLGFKANGASGYAMRRLSVSKEREPKTLLAKGEKKNLTTDRVVLVPGPNNEVACVREIYSMLLNGHDRSAIARHLNAQEGLRAGGRHWTNSAVGLILTNEKYAGKNVWGRSSSRLGARPRPKPACEWITKDNAFDAIVSPAVFNRVQEKLLEKRRRRTDEELSCDLQDLLAKQGKLTQSIINRSKGRCKTWCTGPGALRQFYDRIGYDYEPYIFTRGKKHALHNSLRAHLFETIQGLFANRLSTFELPRGRRRLLKCDTGVVVSIVICASRVHKYDMPQWHLACPASERGYTCLLCRLSGSNDCFLDFFLFHNLPDQKERWFTEDEAWFLTGAPVTNLALLYELVNK